MYIPNQYAFANTTEMVAFMQQYSFATIITSVKERPMATHLPFLINTLNEAVLLTSHFAKANPQWKTIEEAVSLVIFSQPHAYISPRHYTQQRNVPTWNYVAVHAYGKAQLITDAMRVAAILDSTIMHYEQEYKVQYDQLPDDYKSNLSQGIVAFEIVITELQGKKKLSQNKSTTEQQNIITALSHSPLSTERDIAAYMQQNLSQS